MMDRMLRWPQRVCEQRPTSWPSCVESDCVCVGRFGALASSAGGRLAGESAPGQSGGGGGVWPRPLL
jgi:hypothetical protein